MRRLIQITLTALAVLIAPSLNSLSSLGHAAPLPSSAAPTSYVTDWAHLLPAGLYDFIPAEGMTASDWADPEFQEKILAAERKIRPELDKAMIMLPGYMVPLVYEGLDVFEFLLVPSAGQCIHVPPPPVNQTIYVALEAPTRMRTYGEPVIVQGQVRTLGAVTEYAETGYRIIADEVIDFSFDELEARTSSIEAKIE
ncbi:MAG: Uncharacterised protein [Rhodobiaceae bacterium UBA7378]|nr:MAG: Uncharacterised protein [Rhodobiaceae bacterium UBA7378]|tara:strand:- start:1902 stop:2492 length:591 start_codon:yes stop_codon:yes gene_type:complete